MFVYVGVSLCKLCDSRCLYVSVYGGVSVCGYELTNLWLGWGRLCKFVCVCVSVSVCWYQYVYVCVYISLCLRLCLSLCESVSLYESMSPSVSVTVLQWVCLCGLHSVSMSV